MVVEFRIFRLNSAAKNRVCGNAIAVELVVARLSLLLLLRLLLRPRSASLLLLMLLLLLLLLLMLLLLLLRPATG